MKRGLVAAVLAVVLSGCGGGGGGMVTGMPEAPIVTEPESPAAKPADEQAPEQPHAPAAPVQAPVQAPEFPDPATLLRSHDRLALPTGFAAVKADEAMFLLANMPYYAREPGGAWLAVQSHRLRSAALALYEAATERPSAYRADHAVIRWGHSEVVARVNPEVQTRIDPRGGYCRAARGECVVPHPAEPGGVSDGGGRPVKTPIADMPFVSNAMREYSEGVRTRGGVNLRYWSSASSAREVPWAGWKADKATDTWSGYGAWQAWSGFGLVMLSHNHQWDLYDSAWYYPIAGGDLYGGPPSAEVAGTWRGAAVAQANDLSFIADGAIELTVRLGANPTFDLSIEDWQGYNLSEAGIGRPVNVSIQDIDVRNIPIKPDGTFNVERDYWRNATGQLIPGERYRGYPRDWHKRVSGAFYGPGGGEAAGVFTSGGKDASGNAVPGVYGAFGGRKPDDPE